MPLNRLVKPGNPQAFVDWEVGLACFDGKAALFEKMLGRFLEMKVSTCDEIRAMDLAGKARALELALAGPPADGEPELLDDFGTSLETVIAAVREKLS